MKALASVITIGILAFFFNTHTFAADTEHKLEALAHAEEAAKHGEMGHANELLKYAEDSLEQAKTAMQEGGDAHVKKAIKELEEAIEHAKMDHADVASGHARKAVKHLRESGVRTTH